MQVKGGVEILNCRVGEGVIEKVTFEQRLQGEGAELHGCGEEEHSKERE